MNPMIGLMMAGMVVAATAFGAQPGDADPARRADVARKGAIVMPFDLARTTHFFDDRKTGGVETVTANDGADKGQIGLIRGHLSAEAERFGRGDFSDPAQIHGEDMPGLAELARAGAKLHVTYRELPSGASLVYASRHKAVISAIHEWFAAQRADHGANMHMHHPGAM